MRLPVLPLRARLTLAFTGVMAVLLAGASIALSVLVAHNLDSTIDDGLSARAGDAAALVRAGAGAGQGRLSRTGEAFAQVLDPSGRVLESTPGAGGTPLLTPRQVTRGLLSPVIAVTRSPKGAALRVYARRGATRQGQAFVVVVGEPLLQRERALDALHALLAVGG